MADMNYEEVNNTSIAVQSEDRTWLDARTNVLYCTHCEKVPGTRTDVPPFTHGAELPLNVFSLFLGAG